MRASTTALLLAATLAGCSGADGGSSSSGGSGAATAGTGGTTTSSGSGGGSGTRSGGGDLSGPLAFTVGAQWLFTRHAPDGGPLATKLNAKLFEPAFTCADASGTSPVDSFREVEVLLETDDQSDVQPGTYDLAHPPAHLQPSVDLLTHAPNGENAVGASAGTITVVTASAAGMSGSFDVTLPLDDGGSSSLSGSFDAPYCH